MRHPDPDPRPRFRPALDPLEGRETPATLFTAAGTVAGGPAVVGVFGPGGNLVARISPFEPSFTGGARAAAGELDGNPATVEVVAVPGPGGGPRVQVYAVGTADGSVSTVADFLAFEPEFRDGLRVAVGRLDPSSPTDQVVVGADAGGGPRVRTFDLVNGRPVQVAGPLGNFFAFEDTFRGGVRVAVGNLTGVAAAGNQLVVGAGVGGAPRVLALGPGGATVRDFFAPGLGGTGGVNVGFTPLRNGAGGLFFSDALAADVTQRNGTLNALIPAGIGTGFGSTPSSTGVFATGGFATGVFTSGPGITAGVFGPGLVGTGF